MIGRGASAISDIRASEVHLYHRVVGQDTQWFVCASCGRRLPEHSFGLAGTGPTRPRIGQIFYLHPDCRTCFGQKRKLVSEHKMWTPELHRFVRLIVKVAKSSAPKRGLVFAITEDDILGMYYEQNGRCALTGETMMLEHATPGTSKANRRTMSIDRKRSDRSYTRDNVQLVCWAINEMKGAMTEDELRYWCAKVVLHNNEDSE